MKKKSILGVVCCAFLAGAILTACSSSNQSTSSTTKTDNKTSSLKPLVEGSQQSPDQYGFMQVANDNTERLWFEHYYDIAKDSELVGVYLIKNGQATYYNLKTVETTSNSGNFHISLKPTLTFTDLEKMSNEEIIEKAQELDKAAYFAQFEAIISFIQDYIDKGSIYSERHQDGYDEEFYVQGKPLAEKLLPLITEYNSESGYKKYRDSVTNVQLTALVKTDASGNNVNSEKLELPYFVEWGVGDDEGIEIGDGNNYISIWDDSFNGIASLSLTKTNTYKLGFEALEFGTVYESNYIGVSGLATRDFPKGSITFDTLDIKNVVEE